MYIPSEGLCWLSPRNVSHHGQKDGSTVTGQAWVMCPTMRIASPVRTTWHAELELAKERTRCCRADKKKITIPAGILSDHVVVEAMKMQDYLCFRQLTHENMTVDRSQRKHTP